MSAPPPWRGWTEADEAAWEAKYQAELVAQEEALQARGGAPPRHSKVNGPPADWKYWCALLDGIPVAHCTEFDVDEGWCQVYVTEPRHTGVIRVLDTPQRRLHGRVEAVRCQEWGERQKERGALVIDREHLHGDPVPGSEIRRTR